MSEESKIPKPDIKDSTPDAPPVTTVDEEKVEKKKTEAVKESSDSPAPAAGDIEADLVKRFVGALIDGISIAVVTNIISTATSSGILGLLVSIALWLTRDSLPFLEGQSVGKKIMKLKAVKLDGSSLSGDWTTGATRNILMGIPFGSLVEGIVFLLRKDSPEKGTRLGDDWAKTKVIAVD